MRTCICLDTQHGAIVSDGLFRVLLDGPAVDALRTLQPGQTVEVQARAIVVVPLAPEETAAEAVRGAVLDDPSSPPSSGDSQAAKVPPSRGEEVSDG